jgi:hypothetical protein
MHSDEKHEFAAFHYLRSERKKHVGSINSNSLFFHYQTAANCVLIKTQPQPHNQTDSQTKRKPQLGCKMSPETSYFIN